MCALIDARERQPTMDNAQSLSFTSATMYELEMELWKCSVIEPQLLLTLERGDAVVDDQLFDTHGVSSNSL